MARKRIVLWVILAAVFPGSIGVIVYTLARAPRMERLLSHSEVWAGTSGRFLVPEYSTAATLFAWQQPSRGRWQ